MRDISVYLTPKEIEAIFKLDLPRNLHAIRERFLLCCYAGLRWSDAMRIGQKNLENGLLKVTQQKTGREIITPAHKNLIAVFRRNNFALPKATSLNNANRYIPVICCKAKITQMIRTERKIDGEVKMVEVPKCDLVSSHSGRRSFCTNALEAGIPVHKIMKLSGHSTEEMFFRYIKTGSEEVAKELKNHVYFTGKKI